MKILHISRSMGQGGAQKIVYQLCSGNNDIPQCVASAGGAYVDELKEQKIPHYLIPDIDGKNPFIILKTIKTLWSIVKKEKVDIIHTHHRMAAFYARIIMLLNPRLKHIYTAHNVFYGKRLLMRFALKNSRVVAVGDGVFRNLRDEYNIDKKRITVIYNAIDSKEIHHTKLSEIEELKKKGMYVIGGIGRLSKQKGFDILIKATALLKEPFPNLMVVIVGDGEDRPILEALVEKMNLKNSVLFLGYQSDVLDIISQLEFVVLPSRWEGLPLTPIEAFSQSRTIIVSNIPGNNEVVTDNKNGLLFKVDDYRQLADKMAYLISNKEIKDKLSQRAAETYRSKYDYRVFLNGYRKVYGVRRKNKFTK